MPAAQTPYQGMQSLVAEHRGTKLEPEYQDAFTGWKADPSPANNGKMLKLMQPVIGKALKAYGGGSTSPLLGSTARRMVLDALPRYDPNKASMRTFVMQNLKGLHRAQAKETQILSIPEQVQLDRMHLQETENQLRDWLGRDPSDSELADESHMPIKRIAYVRKANPAISEGAMEAVMDPNGPGVASEQAGSDSDDEAWTQFVYHSLDPVNQLILEHSVGLNGKKVLENRMLAKKLGITPSAVSQRKVFIQQQMNQRQQLGIL